MGQFKYINYCYLFYTVVQSIQHRTLDHTDQSRDYMCCFLCNSLHTADYSYHRTVLHYTLLIRKAVSLVTSHFCVRVNELMNYII